MAQTIAGIGAKPRLRAPPKACDCHSHILGPPDKYPYAADHKGPPPVDASLDDYRATLAHLGIERSVIVHTIAHGYDNARTTDAIAELGLDRARGVAICPFDISLAELRRLPDDAEVGLMKLTPAASSWCMTAPSASVRRIELSTATSTSLCTGHLEKYALRCSAKSSAASMRATSARCLSMSLRTISICARNRGSSLSTAQ